jgi:D-lactate dehydrogenase (cytochrome)
MIMKNQKDDLLTYLEDTSGCRGQASSVYLPKDKQELVESIRQLKDKNIPFTASGGRTGTTGGCVPGKGAILSLEGLKKISEINPKNMTVKIEPGVLLDQLEKEANKFNLTLRASPTEGLAQGGGIISTAASGVRGFGYGGIRNYVLEIELIFPQGKAITIKRGEIFAKKRTFNFALSGEKFNFNLPSYTMPDCKSQAGYFLRDNMDLIDLFIGSEGTLGVITSAVLSLQNITPFIFDGMIFFDQEKEALDFVQKIKALKTKKIMNPACLEFFDSNSLDLIRKDYSFIPKDTTAVYFEQEAETEEGRDRFMESWQNLIVASRGLVDKSILGESSGVRKKLFEIRHRLPQVINEFLRQKNQIKAASDIAVPKDKFRRILKYYKEIAKASGLNWVNFGHIGEDHLHFNFLPGTKEESRRAQGYLKRLCQEAVSLGGTVSAEHGIGKIKKPYLKLMYSRKEIEEMAQLKKYFDPRGLLGLDNIFDKELLS